MTRSLKKVLCRPSLVAKADKAVTNKDKADQDLVTSLHDPARVHRSDDRCA
jgi:hypothetical protein